jgi:hypothetical protein
MPKDEQRTSVTLTLADDMGRRVKVCIVGDTKGIEIRPEGYGDHDSAPGYGSPVFLELHKGKLKLWVWADINQEDPTDEIDLEGARENAREPAEAVDEQERS